MMKKANEIYEGWKNHIAPSKNLKPIIEVTSKDRLKICNSCKFHSSNRKGYSTLRRDAHCTDCGCNLEAKTKCLSCECPRGFWKAIQK